MTTTDRRLTKTAFALMIVLSSMIAASAQDSAPIPRRPAHTYSIVARDPATGELGVAVQSHWFSVGSNVSWAEAGVGAVATQAFIEPSYGALGLEMMRSGRSAPDTLKGLIAADGGRDFRQVAMIDAQGRVAAHTGSKAIPAAGHYVGKDFSVEANLMLKDTVWPAMARAFESAQGDLADRMLAALDAAQAEGGDIRGKQSAALIVVRAKSTGRPWADRVFDLRVDDHAEPLRELRRLVTLQRAFQHMNAGDLAMEKKDNEAALREYGAAARLVPDNLEMVYWHAAALANMGRVEESLPLFRRVFKEDANWATLTPRLVKSELLPNDPQLIERILAVAGASAISEMGGMATGPVIYFAKEQVAAGFANGSVLLDGTGRNYMILAGHRDKPGMGEVHTLHTDIIYVQEGSATFVTGGALVDAKTIEPNEIRGASIQGGEAREITKGDVIVVPKNTPHWFKDVKVPFTYYVVKVR